MGDYELSKFGDWIETDESDIDKDWAEIKDKRISDLLLFMSLSDRDFSDVDVHQILEAKGLNKTIKSEFQQGNEEYIRLMRGTDEMGRDVSGYRAITKLENNWISSADNQAVMKILYMGEEGTGKTNGACFEGAEVGARVLKQYVGKKVAIAGNLQINNVDELPIDKAHFISKTSELDDLLDHYKEQKGWELIVILDEGDQILGGFGTSNVTGRAISDRVKLFRKAGAHIIITSQTQVTADLRRNFSSVRKKPDKHNEGKIIVGSQVTSDGDIDEDHEDWRATGFPPTNADYNTLAEGEWDHDIGDEEDRELQEAKEKADKKQEQLDRTLHQLHYEQGYSFGQIAETTGIPKSTVYNRVDKHEDRLMMDESDEDSKEE